MRHADESSPVSFVVKVARLPRRGMPVVVEATQKQREQLAAIHGLLGVEAFRAELLVSPWKRNGVEVKGTVEADIDQQCVVTLEPLRSRISEPVEAVFLPQDSRLGREGFEAGGEIMLDADGPDSPELFDGDSIDVGALAEEFFGLAIDPYPRKAGAELPQAAEAEPDEDDFRAKLRTLLPRR